MDRGFGTVYKAFDRSSGVYVAIKIVRSSVNEMNLLSEIEMLMKCNSPFIVRYNGMIRNETELWVWIKKRT